MRMSITDRDGNRARAMRLDTGSYSSYHGCVHTPKLTGKPKCAFNGDKLVDSVSAGRVIWEPVHNKDNDVSESEKVSK